MNRKGNCSDNAVAESFSVKLKCEYVQDMFFEDFGEAKTKKIKSAIFNQKE